MVEAMIIIQLSKPISRLTGTPSRHKTKQSANEGSAPYFSASDSNPYRDTREQQRALRTNGDIAEPLDKCFRSYEVLEYAAQASVLVWEPMTSS